MPNASVPCSHISESGPRQTITRDSMDKGGVNVMRSSRSSSFGRTHAEPLSLHSLASLHRTEGISGVMTLIASKHCSVCGETTKHDKAEKVTLVETRGEQHDVDGSEHKRYQ